METPLRLLADYSSLRVLLYGLTTALSFSGTGLWALERFFGKKIPMLFALPIGTLLGLHIFSLIVQLFGFSHTASPLVLKGLWYVQSFLGCIYFLYFINVKFKKSFLGSVFFQDLSRSIISRFTGFLFLLLIGLILCTLFIAIVPSTKTDEILYHMLVPLRILYEGGINYHSLPFQAMIPHMHFQIAAAPLYALGVVDAFNVVSWYISTLFVWFCVGLVLKKTNNFLLAVFLALGLYSGMYAPVWFVTGGVGAFSLMSMLMLALLLFERNLLVSQVGELPYLALVSVVSMSLAASKASYIPFAFFCLTVASVYVWRKLKYRRPLAVFLVASSVWLLFYSPALLWTWGVSGYPLGAMLDPTYASVRESIRTLYHPLPYFFSQLAVCMLDSTPLVWGGCILFLFSKPGIDRSVWLLGSSLLFFQSLIVFLNLPLSLRFLGGLPYALALYYWSSKNACSQHFLFAIKKTKALHVIALLCILPWFLMHLLYSAQFFPVVFGVRSVDVFAERYIPHYEDFKIIDEILPSDSVLLAQGPVLRSIYFPRRLVDWDENLPVEPGKKIFLFSADWTENRQYNFRGYQLKPIYENPSTVLRTYRTPGQKPKRGNLIVYELIR